MTDERRTYLVRSGHAEFMVTDPSGRVHFMGIWAFTKWLFARAWAGDDVEVQE